MRRWLREWWSTAVAWALLGGMVGVFFVLPVWLALAVDAAVVAWLWAK